MKQLIAVILLLLGSMVAQDNGNNQEERVAVPKSMLTQDQLAALRSKNIKTDVHEWAGIGKEVGEAVNSSLQAITTQTNSFAQTGVGRVTVALVVWKVLGDQIVHIIGGIAEAMIFLPLWVWSYRKTSIPRRVVIEETIAPDKTKTKKWKVLNDASDRGGDTIDGWRLGHWGIGAALLVVILITIFSY